MMFPWQAKKKAIKKKVMRGYSVPAGLITPPAVHGYTEALNKRRDFDPAASKKLLEAAGYADGFTIQLDCPNNRYINDEGICQAVVGMLAKIAIIAITTSNSMRVKAWEERADDVSFVHEFLNDGRGFLGADVAGAVIDQPHGQF